MSHLSNLYYYHTELPSMMLSRWPLLFFAVNKIVACLKPKDDLLCMRGWYSHSQPASRQSHCRDILFLVLFFSKVGQTCPLTQVRAIFIFMWRKAFCSVWCAETWWSMNYINDAWQTCTLNTIRLLVKKRILRLTCLASYPVTSKLSFKRLAAILVHLTWVYSMLSRKSLADWIALFALQPNKIVVIMVLVLIVEWYCSKTSGLAKLQRVRQESFDPVHPRLHKIM